MGIRTFGATPTGDRLERMHRSPHYKDGVFENPVPTDMRLQDASFGKLLWEFLFNKPKDTVPPAPPPLVKTTLNALEYGEAPQFVWFGHSSYYIKSREATLLVDPVFSGNASPFSFFAKAFPGTNGYSAADVGNLDVLLLTHDHYDHLDYKTVVALAPKTRVIVTALGVGAHLEYWGIPASKIVELDLGESCTPRDGVRLTATPARHFSGRRFKRNGTLWASFVLDLGAKRLFLGGDSGYAGHFAQIGQTYGPFDLAFLECGQYGIHWPFIHMFPEQTYQAAIDLGARVLMPVHWGKFSLAMHPWDEPIRRLRAAAGGATHPATSVAGTDVAPILVTPRIGEVVRLGGPYPSDPWWEKVV
jgi:L-ascorbate metabolism protein UlaG (beta-lactamase superfamily)